MSSSMSLEEKFEALMKSHQVVSSSNQELENQNECLRKQLGDVLKQKQQALASPTGSVHGEDAEEGSNQMSSSSEEEPQRTTRREQRQPAHSNDFRVEIPEFEGRLDLDEFLEWLHKVKWIFDYKEVPKDKKMKLVALRLRKYASLWWENLCAKRVIN